MLGIIHTHPDFEPKLSSVDLHQLEEVQRENPAAISLIILPKQKEYPIYSLTHLGLTRMRNCTTNTLTIYEDFR